MTKAITMRVLAAVCATGLLGGCDVNRQTGERTVKAGAAGAAVGAVLGAFEGDFLESTAKGAAVGAVGGFVYDQINKW